MGTAFTIDIRDPGNWSDAINDVVTWLHHVDATFSTFKPDSDICRIQRRELSVAAADSLVTEVLDLCQQVQQETGGYFTMRLGGQLDPTGLVKGWSVERASQMLTCRGSVNHVVNGGGDVQLRGETSAGHPWLVGVVDPHDRTRIITAISGTDLAVATSGTAERGSHIVNPFTAQRPRDLASVTVIGPSLTRADTYATAAFAMSAGGLAWLEKLSDYEALAVTSDGQSQWTSRWPTTSMGSGGSARDTSWMS
jgi:thiamine biosynthesis lipoprotein